MKLPRKTQGTVEASCGACIYFVAYGVNGTCHAEPQSLAKSADDWCRHFDPKPKSEAAS